MKRQPGKAKLPRGEMPPGTRVHKDKKKQNSRTKCRSVDEPIDFEDE